MVEIEIHHPGVFAGALVKLNPGEGYFSDAGAMYRMSANVNSEVTILKRQGKGGIMGAIKRMLARESFFMATYTTTDGQPGEVGLAPTHQGDIISLMNTPQEQWICSGGSFLGGQQGLSLDPSFQGFKGFFSGEAPFFLNVVGQGQFLVNGYGRIDVLDVTEGMTVDTGHLIAFTQGLQYKISKAAKGFISSFLSGEGFVMRFTGTGKIAVQSHDSGRFGETMRKYMPPREG